MKMTALESKVGELSAEKDMLIAKNYKLVSEKEQLAHENELLKSYHSRSNLKHI